MALGRRLAEQLQPRTVIGLSGDLGAGKTRLVHGLARGLGIPGRVQSPTFALVNVHVGGRMPLYHLDLYRLETPALIQGAGLEEYLEPDGVAVIEWAERWFDPNPPPAALGEPVHFKTIRLEVVSETERRITYEGFSD